MKSFHIIHATPSYEFSLYCFNNNLLQTKL